uniref:RING-CH-type domain-containing protein n=1 Tax=Ascaris lumbricoides TaxID=6252 RepID=A0A0M3HMK9_ASCLU
MLHIMVNVTPSTIWGTCSAGVSICFAAQFPVRTSSLPAPTARSDNDARATPETGGETRPLRVSDIHGELSRSICVHGSEHSALGPRCFHFSQPTHLAYLRTPFCELCKRHLTSASFARVSSAPRLRDECNNVLTHCPHCIQLEMRLSCVCGYRGQQVHLSCLQTWSNSRFIHPQALCQELGTDFGLKAAETVEHVLVLKPYEERRSSYEKFVFPRKKIEWEGEENGSGEQQYNALVLNVRMDHFRPCYCFWQKSLICRIYLDCHVGVVFLNVGCFVCIAVWGVLVFEDKTKIKKLSAQKKVLLSHEPILRKSLAKAAADFDVMLALEQNLNHLCELSSASSSVEVENQPSQKTTLHPNRTNAAHSHSNITLLAAKRYGLIGITLVTYARTLHRAFYI